MSKSDLEQLFFTFRDHGDAAALAQVFDATSTDLLQLARHLAPNAADAEDLLQSTWLTAIEKAGSFDPARPIRPWLVGILVRHARSARRRVNPYLRTESYEPARLLKPDPRDPQELASERELASEVSRALEALPPRYREVVAPRVAEGERGVDIARRVGRRPEIVRVQLARGLRLLRGLLPTGVASALTLTAGARRSVAAVRQRVLARVEGPAGTFGPSSTVLFGASGGLLVVGKLLFVFVALSIVLASTLFWRPTPPGTEPSPTVAASSARTPATPQPGASTRDEAAPPTADPEPVAPAPGALWEAEEGRANGRILVAGMPLSGVSVTLLRPRKAVFDASLSVTNTLYCDTAPVEEVDRSETDDRGRFTVRGLRPGDLHAIGVDLGGGYGSIRAIRQTTDRNEELALGDVELGPLVSMTGVVVDTNGAPLSGVTVRAINAPFPVPLQSTGLAEIVPGSAIGRLEPAGVQLLPAWISEWWSRMPFPTARTDAEGRFQLPGVPRGMVTIVATRHGMPPTTQVLPTGAGAARDVGALTMEVGRVLRGRVARGAGPNATGLPGAEVRVGTIQPLLGLSPLLPSVETDAEGAFQIFGLPEFVDLLAAVRQSPEDAWTLMEIGDVEDISLPLPARAAITVKVVAGGDLADDLAQGNVAVSAIPRNAQRALPLNHPAAREAERSADASGRFVIDDLAIGEYTVFTEVGGMKTPWRVTLPPEGVELQAVLRPSSPLAVRVVFGDDARPIQGARVWVTPDVPDFGEEDEAWTDEAGVARLRLRASADGSGVLDRIELAGDMELRAEHPSLGTGMLRVTPRELLDGVHDFVITLRPSGRIEGRVTLSDAPPPESLLVVAYAFDGFLGFLEGQPYPATTDARGDFVIPSLPAGQYLYKVFPSFLDGDLVQQSLQFVNTPDELAGGSVRLRPGETCQLRVRAFPEDSPVAGRLAGRILLDGIPARGARVSVYPLDGDVEGELGTGARSRGAEVDGTGGYEVLGIAPGTATVQVTLTQIGEGSFRSWTAFLDDLVFRVATTETLSLDLRATDIVVRACAADGKPRRGVSVELTGIADGNRGHQGTATTDDAGEARVRVYQPGEYAVDAYHPDFGTAASKVDARDGALLELVLEQGIPCGGAFRVPPEWEPEMKHGFPNLRFFYESGDAVRQRSTLVWPGDERSFEVYGLPAGPIDVRLEFGGFASDRVRILVPEGGTKTLSIDFR